MRRSWVKLWITILWDEAFRKMTPAQRFVWLGMVCLAGDSKVAGKICITETMGYTLNQLANLLAVDENDITETIKVMGDKSLTVDKNNVITIMNWDKYQSEYMRINKGKSNGKIESTPKSTPKCNTIEGDREGEVEVKKQKYTKHISIRKQFIAPTIEQIRAECVVKCYNIDPVEFFAHYDSIGWTQKNGRPLVSWESTLLQWVCRAKKWATPISVQVNTEEQKKALDEKARLLIEKSRGV